MDSESKSLYLNNLEEMILDEEKLVTYLWLSRKLCIHVNDSKSLLTDFVQKCSKEKPSVPLNITMLLSGINENNQACMITCTSDESISNKNKMKTLFFQHIYSVNKGKPSLDVVALAAADSIQDFSSCVGLIKNDLCLKRSMEEIGQLKNTSYQSSVNPLKKSSADNKNKIGKMESVSSGNVPGSNSKLFSPVKSNSEPILNGAHKEQSTPVKTQKGKSNIANFFNKPNGQKKSKPLAEVSKPKVEKENVQKVKEEKPEVIFNHSKQKQEIIEKSDSECKVDKPQALKKEKVEPISSSSSKKKTPNGKNAPKLPKTTNELKKSAKVDKKRKRVLHVSDSEESDDGKDDPFKEEIMEVSEESDEDIIPATPNTNTVKITSGIVNPRKRRKIVDKTYTDEDGYILTKKEEVYESCSSDEGDKKENIKINSVKVEKSPVDKKVPLKSPTKPKSKKKVSPPQKGKQATLMSFFSKKP